MGLVYRARQCGDTSAKYSRPSVYLSQLEKSKALPRLVHPAATCYWLARGTDFEHEKWRQAVCGPLVHRARRIHDISLRLDPTVT